jgi:hypothetical protein
MEQDIKEEIDPACYKEHLSLMEIALDVDAISKSMKKARGE